MKTIQLTRGMECIVDDADYPELARHSWYADVCRDKFYAARQVKTERGRRALRLHKALMPGAKYVDHINGNTLDCRRENLRESTNAQNVANQRSRKGAKSSRYRGVYHLVQGGYSCWQAHITVAGRTRHLGSFDTEEAAAKARDAAALLHFGEFAKLNF